MKKALPLLLMLWPYMFFLIFLLPMLPGDSERNTGIFFQLYSFLTLAVYMMNVMNALSYKGEKAEQSLAFYSMLIKLLHIPFYLLTFLLGLFGIFMMILPVFIFLGPFLAMVLAVIDYILLLVSSVYGISAAVRAGKKKLISKKRMIGSCIFHCMFVTDVISSTRLYFKLRLENRRRDLAEKEAEDVS